MSAAAAYRIEGAVRSASSGTMAFVGGGPTVTTIAEDRALWSANLQIDPASGEIRIIVIADALDAVRRVATVRSAVVAFP